MRQVRIVLVTLPLFVSPLAAQIPSPGQENQDLAFARVLVERGWAVVAEPVIQRGLASGLPADKDRFRVLEAQLLLRSARATPGAQARAEAWKKASAALDAFAAGGKIKTEGPAASELGELLLSAGPLLAEEVRRETEAARAAEYRKRAHAAIDAAEKIFRAQVEAARAVAAKQDGSAEEESAETGASHPEMEAAYNLARVFFERGMASDVRGERQAALKTAVSQLEDFEATYAETPLAYQAAILVGQCWNELEDFEKAAAAFEGAASLTQQFTDDTGKVHVDNPVATDIIQRALYLKAQAMNRAGKSGEAKASADRALRLFPEVRNRPIGFALRIEGAQALSRQGKIPEAERELRSIDAADPGGPWSAKAREVLARFIGKAGAGQIGDAGPMIQSRLERNDIAGAIRDCRTILAQLDSAEPSKRNDAVPSLLLWLGKSYVQAKRYREAAIAFEELMERYPGHKLAPEGAFQAVSSRLRGNSVAPFKLDLDRYNEDLKTLTEKYKSSPQASAGQFLKADAAMAERKFEEAAALYLAVPEAAGQYRDTAIYQAAFAWWNQAARDKTAKERKQHYQEAEKLFQNVLQICARQEPDLDADRVANRATLRLRARVNLADIYSSPSLQEHQKALEVIEAIEKQDNPDPGSQSLLYQSRVRTLAALDRLEDAAQSYKALLEKDPGSRAIPQLCRDLAAAFDRRALELRKSGEGAKGKSGEKEYHQLLSSALEYYAEWLEQSVRLRVRPAPAQAVKTADRALAIALEVSGLPEGKDSFTDALSLPDVPRPAWEQAIKLLEEARPKQRGSTGQDWLPVAKLGRAYGFLKDWDRARANLEEALVWGGVLASTGEAQPTPKPVAFQTAPDLLDIFIDLGFAELIPGKKGGLTRARAIFERAFDHAERETCAWWKCRYGAIATEVRDGAYDRADGALRIIQSAFADWDGGKCGLKEMFEAMDKELGAKLPRASGDQGPKK